MKICRTPRTAGHCLSSSHSAGSLSEREEGRDFIFEVFVIGGLGRYVGAPCRYAERVCFGAYGVLGMSVNVVIQKTALAAKHHHQAQVKLAHHGIADNQQWDSS